MATGEQKAQVHKASIASFQDVLALLERAHINDRSVFAFEHATMPRDITDIKAIVQDVTK